MLALLFVEMLHRVTEECSWEHCRILVKECEQSRIVFVSSEPYESTGGLMNQILVVIYQKFRNPEGVVHLTIANEV